MKISQRLNEISEELRKHSRDGQLSDALRERAVEAKFLVPQGDLETVSSVLLERLEEGGFNKSVRLNLNPNFLLKLSDSDSPSARKLSAKFLPEKFLRKFTSDTSSCVLYETARRCSKSVLKEMMLNNLDDDGLYSVLVERFGIPEEEKMANAERFADVADDKGDDVELSDAWYAAQAIRFVQEYGIEVENSNKEGAVARYCTSLRVSTGVHVDDKKLYQAIKDYLDCRDAEILEVESHGTLREMVRHLTEAALQDERILEAKADRDPIKRLMSEERSAECFVLKASSIFDVKEAKIPKALARVTEVKRDLSVPVKGKLPPGKTFDRLTERSLDRFVKCWTECVGRMGQKVTLSWAPGFDSTVSFAVNAK
jgi:hypothetical protein